MLLATVTAGDIPISDTHATEFLGILAATDAALYAARVAIDPVGTQESGR